MKSRTRNPGSAARSGAQGLWLCSYHRCPSRSGKGRDWERHFCTTNPSWRTPHWFHNYLYISNVKLNRTILRAPGRPQKQTRSARFWVRDWHTDGQRLIARRGSQRSGARVLGKLHRNLCRQLGSVSDWTLGVWGRLRCIAQGSSRCLSLVKSLIAHFGAPYAVVDGTQR